MVAPPDNEVLWGRSLHHAHQGSPALLGVSLGAHAGEILGVTGPRGAGKTTLLRCLSGQLVPDAGEVGFDGTALHTVTDANAIADAQSMYLILNHAVGGWAGTPTATTPQDFLIDYVRVYQKSTLTTPTAWKGTAAAASWDSGGNWAAGTPQLEDQVAAFGTNTNAAVAVTWNNSRTIGGLTFDGSTAYTVGNGNGGLQLANTGGTAAVTVAPTTTAPQAISSRIEAYDGIAVTNSSAQTLTLGGQIVGDGGLTFEGAGTTVVSNNNTYAGDTFIDSGTQGAAVVRADRSRAFGSTGTVWFNTAGNNTTGRLELVGSREQPNDINLSGRNNSSVAIENVSDNNKLSGTISALSGGGSYTIQSDAGQLELSATAAGANGVALQASASGNRTFTLQGAGNGLVSGQVINGSGVIGLNKAGGGTWTLNAANTYTGATTVSEGKLVINGQQTGGAYNVLSGATLGGSGTIDPTAGGTLAVAGTLSPGNSIGTFTVGSAGSANNVVFSAGGTLAIEIGAAGAADQLAVIGGLNLASAGDVLGLTALGGAFDGSTYTIATFTPGTLGAGRFDQVYLNGVLMTDNTNLPGVGYRLQYADAAGLVQLVSVPEPAGLVMAAVAGLAVLRRRHAA